MSLEFLRAGILFIGWPVLIIGGIVITLQARKFQVDVKGTVFAQLVPATIAVWLINMFSLGATATFFMIYNLEKGVMIVLPIFLIWAISMIIAMWSMKSWSKEAININVYYGNLEVEIEKRTSELVKKVDELERLNKLMIGRELRIKELKDRIMKLRKV